MATFHIHEDPHEKENVVNNPGKQHNKNHHQDVKEKRSTLAVLSNVGHHMVRGQQGKTTVFGKQMQHNKLVNIEKHVFTSTNFQQQQQQQKKIMQSTVTTTKTTTEQITKTFAVYEDEQITASKTCTSTAIANDKNIAVAPNDKSSVAVNDRKIPTSKVIEDSTNGDANTSASAIRDPLKEITSSDGFVETPMSESEVVLPMSVDKSLSKIDSENLPPSGISPQQHSKKNSDRLYEVDEYQKDILDYYREVEKKHRPKPNYMKRQPDINSSMRTILVDWLVEVSEEYKLHTETLYLAVSYIDRFLSYMSVVRGKLQLVGTAAMFIAAKYEEIYPPDIGEFVFITDDTYTKAQVLRMEQIILKILSFDLNVPSPPVFLNLFAILHDIPDQVKFLATYLSELTLLEGEPYLQYSSSQISSAALALSRYILEYPMWCIELQMITNYSLSDLKDIIFHICRSHNAALKLQQQAIQEKYKSSKYMQVSRIKPVELDEDQLNYLIRETMKGISAKKINDSLSINK